MGYRINRILLLVLLSLSLPFRAFGSSVVPKARFYVSPAGNDSWSGMLRAPNVQRNNGPFKSLKRPRDAIRALKRSGDLPVGGVTVCIRGGVYPVNKTFRLTAEDSGTGRAPIVYKAYKAEEVRLVGGREIRGFSPIDAPAILSRIDKAYQNKILQVALRREGITDFGELKPRGFGRPMYAAGLELFFWDKPMQLARWPNRGWAKIAAVPAGKQGGKFTYEGDRPRRWVVSGDPILRRAAKQEPADDIWLHGYWT